MKLKERFSELIILRSYFLSLAYLCVFMFMCFKRWHMLVTYPSLICCGKLQEKNIDIPKENYKRFYLFITYTFFKIKCYSGYALVENK